MNDRPTSKDVAEFAGVSRATVSLVINNKHGGNVRISEGTRRKVWDAVETLGYRPSAAAQMLKTQRSNMLALMLPHIDTPYQPQFAAAVQNVSEKYGMDVIIYATRGEAAREIALLDSLISRGIDGVILHSNNLKVGELNELVRAGIAVAVHGKEPQHPFVDNVMIDEVQAAADAVGYLIAEGHQRIGLISGPHTSSHGRDRRQGYLQALRANNLPIENDLIYEADFHLRGAGRQGMTTLLELSSPPSAVFAASDLLAVDALLKVLDSGLRVPEDVAIIGFDNTPEGLMVRPQLTTIDKDTEALADALVQLLMSRINSRESIGSRQILLPHNLIVRGSAAVSEPPQ